VIGVFAILVASRFEKVLEAIQMAWIEERS
jgi:FeS assembly protein IscX